MVGKILGDSEHAPVNIGFIVIIASFSGLMFVLCTMPDNPAYEKLINLFSGVILATLGYVFGKAGK